jgi:hypothetical protein
VSAIAANSASSSAVPTVERPPTFASSSAEKSVAGVYAVGCAMAGIAARAAVSFRPESAYTAAMRWEQALGVAFVVGVVSPALWLSVNALEAWLKRLLREQVAQRQASRAAADGGRGARLPQ